MDSRRIYIVEGDKALQVDLCTALKKRGFDVRIFDSGYPIVAMMDNWPDVFLIDIELPDINGMEVCKWLKTHDSSCNIPVIFLSGNPYLKTLAASAMADDYIERSVDLDTILNKIMDYVSRNETPAVSDEKSRRSSVEGP